MVQLFRSSQGLFAIVKVGFFYYEGSVYRGLSETDRCNWKKLSEFAFFQWASETGKLVKTEEVGGNVLQQIAQHSWTTMLKHEKIPFVSYPYEWSFGLLKDAVLIQLELLEHALESDIILNDSTSFNIQWEGFAPVFIDILSFEALMPNEPWVGYRQFCQLFLYPLMLQAYKGVCFFRTGFGAILIVLSRVILVN